MQPLKIFFYISQKWNNLYIYTKFNWIYTRNGRFR